jgi:pimeloyl-ACP methyl ester carboxylesterase
MPTKSKKIVITIIVVALIISCTVISISKYRRYVHTCAARTINESVDIGGCKLYVQCYGKGKPTVIFESGLNCSCDVWCLVQPEISKVARTFAYDRAGVGLSEKSPLPTTTSLDQVHQLHTLLKKSKVGPPYIIVAHSLGGYNARLFATTYPKEVVGIVFIDSSHEDQSFSNSPGSELTSDELRDSSAQVIISRKKDALRNIPIIVLTAGEDNESWTLCQNDIASLSNKSKHIFVNCGHRIQSEQPQIVINSIKEIIKEVQK